MEPGVLYVSEEGRSMCSMFSESFRHTHTHSEFMPVSSVQHPHCVTAYHITCAFSSGLETHTRLDVRNKDGVIHEVHP